MAMITVLLALFLNAALQCTAQEGPVLPRQIPQGKKCIKRCDNMTCGIGIVKGVISPKSFLPDQDKIFLSLT